MRGDNYRQVYPGHPALGSPPHAWGQLDHGATGEALYRFTPTCVGTTKRAFHKVGRCAVHPHMRGDNTISAGFFSPHSPTGGGGNGGQPRSAVNYTFILAGRRGFFSTAPL
mgnify:FL=1